jgi:mannan endo-1,4-beta-mannosidase
VFVEPGWEMNSTWYPWAGMHNGGEAADAPRKFIEAWRFIHGVFTAQGATNTRWVFSPNTGNPVSDNWEPKPERSHWNWWGNYYPGDRYVDYIGVHGFNGPSRWDGPWRDFWTMLNLDGTLDDMLAGLVTTRPIIIGEFATEEGRPRGTVKADWIAEAYTEMLAHPRFHGAVWFDMRKEMDWRIGSSRASANAYEQAMASCWIVNHLGEVPDCEPLVAAN